LRDLPGTQPYFFAKRGVAIGMYEQLGKPQFFLTVTCHARQPNILAAVITAKLIREEGRADREAVARILHAYQMDEDHKWKGMTANQLCNSMPAILARQFMHGLRQLLYWMGAEDFTAEDGADAQDRPAEDGEDGGKGPGEDWAAAPAAGEAGQCHAVKGDKPPFKVKDYIVRIEWQKRGYPHAHILLWTDVPDVTGKKRPENAAEEEEVDWSDEEARARAVPTCAEELSDKYICTKSAHRWMEDARLKPEDRGIMARLANLAEHKCGPYCGKYTLGSCRFGFPRVRLVLIDKLPSGGPSAQWGRMYVAPMDEPRLCDLLDGAELGEDGEVYVTGVQGMMAAPARLEFLHAALQVLEAHHEAYKGKPAVKKALADMAHILEQMPAQQRQPQELVGGEGAEEEAEGLEITYLLPRDPAIPKADRADLQQLRHKAKSKVKNIDPVLFTCFPAAWAAISQRST
jgi:hypothetical protein